MYTNYEICCCIDTVTGIVNPSVTDLPADVSLLVPYPSAPTVKES